MSESTLKAYIPQSLEAYRTPDVTVAWQGGDPTRMRGDFFRNVGGFVEKYRKPEQRGFGLGKRESRDDADAGIEQAFGPVTGQVAPVQVDCNRTYLGAGINACG
jgi:hypothetical protein